MNKSLGLSKEVAYAKMYKDIKDGIESGAIASGSCIVSERKLSEKYGIAYLTVRKGIEKLQEDGLLVKIPRKGIFIRDDLAEVKEAGRICYYVPSLNSSIWQRTLSGIEVEVSNQGFSLQFIEGYKNGAEKIVDFVRKYEPDGLIYTGDMEKDFYYRLRGIKPDMKIVFVGNNSKVPEANCVKAENTLGAFMATEHLLSRGCLKPAYIAGFEPGGNNSERYEGYMKAMRGSGIEPRKIINPKGDDERLELVSKLIASGEMPDGIFCFSDIVAMQWIRAMLENNWKVPGNTLVAGFSNLSEAEYFMPSVTSVDTNHKEMGRSAAEGLIDIIKGRTNRRFEVEISARLIVRESSIK